MGSTLTSISALRQSHVGDGKNSGQTRALTPCKVVNVLAKETTKKHSIAKDDSGARYRQGAAAVQQEMLALSAKIKLSACLVTETVLIVGVRQHKVILLNFNNYYFLKIK